MSDLSHIDDHGRAKMVDVSLKKPQRRMACATGTIALAETTRSLIREDQIRKGNVLGTAQIAGIQAAKRTAELIPLCHPLQLDDIAVTLAITDEGVSAESQIRYTGRTGVEMEALTAVSVALLTVYDMCKAVDKQMHIGQIILAKKVKEDVQ